MAYAAQFLFNFLFFYFVYTRRIIKKTSLKISAVLLNEN